MTLPRLRALREDAFLSQRQLAEQAGVHEATITRAERGERVELSTARRLADALGAALGRRVAPAELTRLLDQP